MRRRHERRATVQAERIAELWANGLVAVGCAVERSAYSMGCVRRPWDADLDAGRDDVRDPRPHDERRR